MTTTMDAVYENGMFRPTEPVSAPEGTRAKVTMPLDEAPIGNDDQRPNETPYGRSDTDGVRHSTTTSASSEP